jgi:hypothetical protein
MIQSWFIDAAKTMMIVIVLLLTMRSRLCRVELSFICGSNCTSIFVQQA